jgi:hypothetical protein
MPAADQKKCFSGGSASGEVDTRWHGHDMDASAGTSGNGNPQMPDCHRLP